MAKYEPNIALDKLRELASRYTSGSEDEPETLIAIELAQQFEALDQWLTNGGFLPSDWKKGVAP